MDEVSATLGLSTQQEGLAVMSRQILKSAAILFAWISAAHAENTSFSGPFHMCPDAHGADQKALFRIIDLSAMPLRIEGMGERRIDGFSASVAASRTATVLNQRDPIEEAFEKLAGTATIMGDNKRRLVAVCFALEPPPKEDIDGPFIFMPGYFIEETGEVTEPFDTIVIPEQTYLVLTFTGSSSDVGNMRYTLTEDFWPNIAPSLGLARAIGPNIMIWPPGFKGNEEQVTLEMWTPIQPFGIRPP